MKKIILLIALAFSSLGYAQDVSVTLSVDMNAYCGAPITTLYVSGTFNSWSGDANPMTDDNADGVYDVTLTLAPGTDSILYKFQANQWAIQESFSPGDPCTVTADGFTNRVLLFSGDITVPTVCWNSCSACVETGLDPIQLDIDWEGDVVDYTVSDFGENSSMLDVDPTNAANTVLKTDRSASAPTWAGTTLSTPCGLAEPIPFDINNNVITVNVYSPVAGAVIRLKAEDHLDPTHSVETEATITAANTWETLTFDFSNEATGTAEINYTYTFDMLSIFYNFGVDGGTAGAQTYYCDDIIFGGAINPSTNDVTFKVDMNDYTGTFTQIQLNGNFNGWCGDCNPMTDDDADGVWEVTLPIEAASIEYKFTYDNWTGQETLTPGMECTLTTDGFTNRFLEINGDTILPVVCWESCVACTGMPTTADVTFKVDMDGYTGSYTTVNLNGVFNGWCGSCAEMTDDDGDNVYELTVNVSIGTIEYKFTVDGWTDQEMFTEGDPCTSTIDGFTNRTLDVTEDAVLDVVCWNSCTTCTGTPTTADVTFKVDMDGYTGSYTTVNLNGVFNGWCGSCAEMTDDDGDNVYELTVNVSTGTIEYKFTVDGWTDQEMFTEGDPCTSTIDGFTNRTLDVSEDAVLDVVCWNSCAACLVGVEEIGWLQDFTVSPNPSNGIFKINGSFSSATNAVVNVMDIQGKIIYRSNVMGNSISETIDLTHLDNGIYFISVSSDLGSISEKILILK